MNEYRAIITGGQRGSLLASRAPKARKGEAEPSLAALPIARSQSRISNQRREDRHLNLADRAELRFRRRRIEAAVVNVSRHGAMVEAAIEPRIGERMQIEFESCNRTDCTVRWVRGTRIGLEFSLETEVIAPSGVKELVVGGRREGEAQSPPENQPRAPRQSLLWKAVLHWDQGTLRVRVRNISAEGAMLEGREEVPVGAGIVLNLGDGISEPATVRWSRSGQLGIRFDRKFDLQRLVRPEPQPGDSSPPMLQPDYLKTAREPDSPWAARWDVLAPEDLEQDED